MTKIQVNFGVSETFDFVVDLQEWQGKEMTRDYVTETIQRVISDFESGDIEGHIAYTLCGDTLVVVTRDDDLGNWGEPYTVMVSKVTHRGFGKAM